VGCLGTPSCVYLCGASIYLPLCLCDDRTLSVMFLSRRQVLFHVVRLVPHMPAICQCMPCALYNAPLFFSLSLFLCSSCGVLPWGSLWHSVENQTLAWWQGSRSCSLLTQLRVLWGAEYLGYLVESSSIKKMPSGAMPGMVSFFFIMAQCPFLLAVGGWFGHRWLRT
jgi:hypothetical protein